MTPSFSYDPNVPQKNIEIFKDNSEQWHVLISDEYGPGVLGKFEWLNDTTISSVKCVSVRGLYEVAEVSIQTDSFSESLIFTLGDASSESMKPFSTVLNMTKGKDYSILFQNLPSVQSGGGNGSILSRPKPMFDDEDSKS
jgi:hypothetical protein